MTYFFDEFEVNVSHYWLSKNKTRLEIEPRVFQLLVYLCENPHRPIPREELVESVWGGRVISDAAVNRAIGELRKIIERDSANPNLIETISKVGYQFNANLENAPKQLETNGKSLNTAKITVTSRSLVGVFIGIFILVIVYYFSKNAGIDADNEMQERALVALKGTSFKGAYSPSGEQLAFLHKPTAEDVPQIWLRNQEGHTRPLTDDGYYYIYVMMASSNKIFATRFDNLTDRNCEIVSFEVKAEITEHIFDCAPRAITKLDFDEQKQLLYFNHRIDVNAPFGVYSFHLPSQTLQQLTLPQQSGNTRGDYLFSLSPNNNKLAVFEYQSDSMSLLKVVDLLNNDQLQQYDKFEHASGLGWLDDDTLALSNRKGILLYELANKSKVVMKADNSVGHANVNSDTGAIAFSRGGATYNLYQYDLAQTSDQQSVSFTVSSFTNSQPVFANTSNKLAYLSTDSGEMQLVIKPHDKLPMLTELDDPIRFVSRVHWSPDDNSIVGSINDHMYLIQGDTNIWKRLLPEVENIHYVHFANDDTLMFSSDMSGSWQLWTYNINSKELKQLTLAGGYSAQGDPNTGVIYLTKFNEKGLFKLNLASGEETELIKGLNMTNWSKWQLLNGKIYYLDRTVLSIVDVSSGNKQALLDFGGSKQFVFSISPDEQHIIREQLDGMYGNIWQLSVK